MTTGIAHETLAWQKAIVVFLGPMPGLILSVVLLFKLDLPAESLWTQFFGIMFAINYLNLLPMANASSNSAGTGLSVDCAREGYANNSVKQSVKARTWGFILTSENQNCFLDEAIADDHLTRTMLN
jgi:hypothetical protein